MELPKISKDDFLRKVFIQIHNDKRSPLDLLAMEFGEVEETEEQFYYIAKKFNGYSTHEDVKYKSYERKTTKNAYVQEGGLYTYGGEQYYADTSGYREIDAIEVVDVVKDRQTRTVNLSQKINISMTSEFKETPIDLKPLMKIGVSFELIDHD